MCSHACQTVSMGFSIGSYFRSPVEHLLLLLLSVGAELRVSRGGAAEESVPGDNFPLSPPWDITARLGAGELGRTCSSASGGYMLST